MDGVIAYGESSGPALSIGLVDDFDEPEDYSGHFVDANLGNNMGIDHCFDPTKDYSTATKATCITFGSGINGGVGYDYYSAPIVFVKWGSK